MNFLNAKGAAELAHDPLERSSPVGATEATAPGKAADELGFEPVQPQQARRTLLTEIAAIAVGGDPPTLAARNPVGCIRHRGRRG